MEPYRDRKEGSAQAQSPEGKPLEDYVHLLDYAFVHDNSTSETRSWSGWLREMATELHETGMEAAQSAGETISSSAQSAGQALMEAPRKIQKLSAHMIAEGLQRVAQDPEVESTIGTELVKLAPGLGDSKIFADSWLAYHVGDALQDEEMKHQGRTGVHLVLARLNFTVLTLGAANIARSARVGRILSRGAKVLTGFGKYGKHIFGVEEHIASYTANTTRGRSLADKILMSIEPNENLKTKLAAKIQEKRALETPNE